MKQLRFVGSSLDDLRDFPLEVRRECGRELSRVQNGLMPTDWKPMLQVGTGVYELRVHTLGEWRIIYIARHKDAVYVLHAFHKKTQQTRQSDITLARKRYQILETSHDK